MYTFSNTPSPQKASIPKNQSFATILRHNLGTQAWFNLAPGIRKRFTLKSQETEGLHFVGTMQWVYCSPLGALLARLLRPFAILPEGCTRNSPFDFKIASRKGAIHKQRRYGPKGENAFYFRSLFSAFPRLHEEFRGGLGMYLQLTEKQGALLFQDQGYFLRLGSWRLPLPAWLTMGHFTLLHRNLDNDRFQIILEVVHPLFGTLFYQRGEFWASP